MCSIKGHQQFVYSGDRTKEELLPFAMRMSGPPVTAVGRPESIDMLKAKHDIFFAFVGKQDGALWDTYHSVAENYQAHGYFFATTPEVASKHFTVDTLPAVMVYKERNHYSFPRKIILLYLYCVIIVNIIICFTNSFVRVFNSRTGPSEHFYASMGERGALLVVS